MARALARGWGEPVLCTDSGSGRAKALVAELGGEALATNAELAERAEMVVLCHKPYQLEALAPELSGARGPIASVLGATSLERLRSLLPGADVVRLMPNTPVEVRAGMTLHCADAASSPEATEAVLARFRELGAVVSLPESQFGAGTGLTGTTPAYYALVAEAQVDAAVRHGIPAAIARSLVVEAMAGSAALLRARDGDTLAVRREVTSPGGSTARGLRALEQAGVREAFQDALDAVMGP